MRVIKDVKHGGFLKLGVTGGITAGSEVHADRRQLCPAHGSSCQKLTQPAHPVGASVITGAVCQCDSFVPEM